MAIIMTIFLNRGAQEEGRGTFPGVVKSVHASMRHAIFFSIACNFSWIIIGEEFFGT